jgi:formylmethanofuran dehydrogenase subunit A
MKDLVSWYLTTGKGYAIKAVNPGGVESWKWKMHDISLDSPVKPFGVTAREISLGLAEAATDLKLPHGLHIHANQIGEPGNYKTTLETMKTLSGHNVHFTHIQYHSYGITNKGRIQSAAREVAEFVNAHPEFTCDVGQIVFGPATTMTADSPMQYRLHEITGNKWANTDVELETGAGIVPITYRPDSLVNAVQWCIGLEHMLLIKSPWQIFMSTDHPNAGPFTDYPVIIRLLMDADFRNAVFDTLHPDTVKYTNLKDLKREYTFEEIAIITRSGTAKSLGLERKGHLGTGADADVAIYRTHANREKMFRFPTHVLKDGQIVVKDAEIVDSFRGRRFFVEPDADRNLSPELTKDFLQYYSVELSSFPVQKEYISRPEVIPCK